MRCGIGIVLIWFGLYSSVALSPALAAPDTTTNPGGNALIFDGTNDFIAGDSLSGVAANTFTYEFWAYPTGTISVVAESTGGTSGVSGQRYAIFPAWGGTGGNAGAGVSVGTNGVGVFEHADSYLPALLFWQGTLTGWTHIAVVYADKQPSLYINGVWVRTGLTSTKTNVYPSLFLSDPIGYGDYYAGQIDEFRIWSTTLTAAEIRANMYRELGATTGLLVIYHFNEASGTTASDSSGNGRDGTLNNFPATPWRTSGAFAGPRNALDFDGTDDYILTGLNPSTMFGQSFTLEAWVYPRSAGNFRGIGGDHDGISGVGVVFGQYSSGGGGWEFGGYDTNNLGLPAAVVPAIPLNQWSHVAAVYVGNASGAGSITVYLNGVQAAQSTWSNRAVSHMTTFYIGQALDTGDRRFNGQIDEFRVWNTARTAAQISNDMAHTLVGNESGLQAYYRFDQANDAGQTTLYDLTANNRNGTLTNMDATTDWVASAAFNTWIGAESTDWATADNWSRSAVPVASDTIGIYTYDAPTNAPALGGTATLNTLAVNAPLTANADLTVTGNLILNADLTAGGSNVIVLDSSATVNGANDIVGTVRRTSPATGSALQFNNPYTTLNFSTAPTQMDVKLTKTAPSGWNKPVVKRYYTLTPTGSVNATVQLAYQTGELNGTTEADLLLWRYDTGQDKWTFQGGTANTTNHYVALTGVTQFSDWALSSNGPTSAILSKFNARFNASKQRVRVNWTTASELNVVGFNVWRKSGKGEWKMLNPSLIPAKNLGEIVGANYARADQTVKAGKTYRYKLEIVLANGQSEWSDVKRVKAE